MKSVSKSLVLSLWLVLFSACASLTSGLREPKVTLDRVNITEPTATDATLVMDLLVDNPNSQSITLDQLDYVITLGGKEFSTGSVKEGLHVDANSKATIPIPLKVKYTDLYTTAAQLIKFGPVPYMVTGKAKMGLFSMPFEKKGEVKLGE